VRGARIALVPQDTGSALDPLRRVGPQVAAAARLHDGAGRRAGAVLARQLLTWVGIADAARVAAARPAQLSGGMRQRALVAAALAGRPELVVADEPTSALDAGTAGQVLDLLARARAERGTAVLLISHDLALVADRADVVVVLDAGRVVETGPTDRVLRAPRHPVTRALEAAGRPRLARRPAPTGPELLVVADVTVVHRGRGRAGSGGVRALAGVSLTVPEGGGLGVVGESGSGKSTLAQSVVGLQPVTAGAVRLAGAPPAPGDGRAQLVFQDPASALDRRQTVGAALQEALTLARRRGRPAPPGEVLRLLDRVELPPDIAQRRPWQLSGGQRQRVVIARALAARPRLLVLDEPVSSLDAVVRAGVLELLGSVRDDGVALLVVSHDLSAVTALADEVLVLHRGAVVRRGAPAQVLAGVPAGPVPEPAAPVRGAASSPSIERTPS
jgi:ABC-type glutathione transport system ATPase component